ncbi:MAG: hypothetical protein JWM60_726 [Solirubrobacterales bacterium]|nr:hypothetical protein [Solirubrobacterales bacterium]
MSLAATSASATVLSSAITSPSSDPAYLATSEAPFSGPLAQSLAISGTVTTDDANAADTVELGCFYVSRTGLPAAFEVETLEGNTLELEVQPDGTFSTAGLSGEQRASLNSLSNEQPCTLRAVPPGTLPSAALAAFRGPRLGMSAYEVFEDVAATGKPSDFYTWDTTLEGYWGWDSASSCGPYARVYDPLSFRREAIEYNADCEGNLDWTNESGTAASMIIDGHNAYGAWAQHEINNKGAGETYVTGEHHALNPLDGSITQTWTEVLMRCVSALGAPADGLKPEAAACPNFAPTGVELLRTITTGQNGLQATVSDRFQSTDGASHVINLEYGEEDNALGEHPSYRFPGDAGFSERAPGSLAAVPSAPATIYFESNPKATEPGDPLQNTPAAITLSAAPDRVVFADRAFDLVYGNRTVPATGALAFTEVLSQGLSLERVQQLAQLGEDRLAGPSVAISSPGSGAVLSTPSVTVTGTASDNFGVASLNVGGAGVPYAGSGPWSSTLALKPGANTITATATDHAGNAAGASVTVTYQPPSPKPGTITLSRIGVAKGLKGKVAVTLACNGPAGSSCVAQITLTSVEKLKHGKLSGVTAKTRSKRVTVGAARVTIPAGKRKTVTIALNATGRRLLARFRRLPTHVVVQLIGPGAKRTTVTAQNVTVQPLAQKHKRKH